MLHENPLECGHIAALVTGKLHTQVDRLLVPLHVKQRLGLIGNRVVDVQFEPASFWSIRIRNLPVSDPVPAQVTLFLPGLRIGIRIILGSWIRIRIWVKSWMQIWMIQSQNLGAVEAKNRSTESRVGKNPGFFLNPAQWVFLFFLGGLFGFFWGFFGFFA